MTRRAPVPRLVPRALVLAFVFGALLGTGLTPIRPAAPVRASTAQVLASDLRAWINDARAKHGLGALRSDSRLVAIASERAATLASLNALSHDAAGCLKCQLASRGVSYNLMGEVLASNNYPWGSQSASIVFSSWKNSPTHWDLLMGSRWDSIGIGVSLSSNGTTYASAVLIDAPGVTASRTTTKRAATTRKVAAAEPAPLALPTRREGSIQLGRIPC